MRNEQVPAIERERRALEQSHPALYSYVEAVITYRTLDRAAEVAGRQATGTRAANALYRMASIAGDQMVDRQHAYVYGESVQLQQQQITRQRATP